jgi:hypothetical protein
MVLTVMNNKAGESTLNPLSVTDITTLILCSVLILERYCNSGMASGKDTLLTKK